MARPPWATTALVAVVEDAFPQCVPWSPAYCEKGQVSWAAVVKAVQEGGKPEHDALKCYNAVRVLVVDGRRRRWHWLGPGLNDVGEGHGGR